MKNKTLLTDFYQLTMAQGYFERDKREEAVFDLFYRRNPCGHGYAIFAGLNQAIDFVNNIEYTEEDLEYLSGQGFNDSFLDYLRDFEFNGDIYAVPEGSVVFPHEPLLKVKAPILQAQLLETALLNIINHQSLIATKAARIATAAKDRAVLEFGLRRAHGPDAGYYGARAAVIGGCQGTSNVLSGKDFGVNVAGTHAHSWVMTFDSELEAFRTYARNFPDSCILLVDTYDTLGSGVPNAIKVFEEMEEKGVDSDLYGIRLDSGDLAYLSKQARSMLDEAGFEDATIVASSSLDEDIITSLDMQDDEIDVFGVGTKLITSSTCPSFGGVYKLSAYDGTPKIKISDNVEKITNPGDKRLLRLYDRESDKMIADLMVRNEEVFDENEDMELFDPRDTWKTTTLAAGGYRIREMHREIFRDGSCVYEKPEVSEIKEYCEEEKESLWEEYKRLVNPHIMKVNLSHELYDLKQELLKVNGVKPGVDGRSDL